VRIREEGLVTRAYKHVDGTSFSSPIVASIAAQMFEANPELTSREAKRILIETARRLPDGSTDRQGWGLVDPKRAVLLAAKKREGRSSAPRHSHGGRSPF
jgi:serine protease AprX